VTTTFDMADVGGIETHPCGELFLGHPAVDAPSSQLTGERLGCTLHGRDTHEFILCTPGINN
jgi:hypothetical protein